MRDELFDQILSATAGEYEIHGELGRDWTGRAYLAREIASGQHVVLRLPSDSDALEVLPRLSSTVPMAGGVCADCGDALTSWGGRCLACGAPVAGIPAEWPWSPSVEASVLEEVRHAAGDSYEVLGAMEQEETGGTVLFAREVASDRLVALALHADEGDGGRYLAVIWEGPVLARSRPAASPPPPPTPEAIIPAPPPADLPPAGGGRPAGAPAARAGEDAEEEPIAGASAAPAPHSRRLLLPALLVIALVAAAAFLLARTTPETASEGVLASDSMEWDASPAPAPIATSDAAAAPSVAPPPATLPVVDSAPPPVRIPRQERAAARPAPRTGKLQLGGALPPSWTRSVNGRAPTSERTVELTAGRPATIRIEAPGFCPESLRVTLPAGGRETWTPQMKGRPMVGECE